MELPPADPELVDAIVQELKTISKDDRKAYSAARFRYGWALVHSTRKQDVPKGLKLCQTMLRDKEGDERDLLYLLAVAQYRQKTYLDARKTLDRLLEVSPTCSQAKSLKAQVEDQIVKEGLVGVGLAAAAVGVVGAVVASVVLGSRR